MKGSAMDPETYTSLLYLAAGAVVLTAVLVVWRRNLRGIVRLLAWQAIALAAVPIVRGVHTHDAALIGVGVGVSALRAAILPVLLARAVGRETARREAAPLLNTSASLLVTAVLTVAAFGLVRPLAHLDPDPAVAAAPAGLAVVFIALFVMVTRRHAASQAAGFLMLDNGIAALAFLLTAGVPVTVELGASLDVFFAIMIIGVLTGRLHRAFGRAEIDQLQELHD